VTIDVDMAAVVVHTGTNLHPERIFEKDVEWSELFELLRKYGSAGD